MIRNSRLRAVAIAAMLAIWSGAAVADDVAGVWLHEDGSSKVRFASCGPSICGTIVWLKDASGPWKIGQRVFYDMTPDGASSWSGKAFEATSGREYTGKMTLKGSSLTTAGCVLAGLICKSIVWSRSQ